MHTSYEKINLRGKSLEQIRSVEGYLVWGFFFCDLVK